MKRKFTIFFLIILLTSYSLLAQKVQMTIEEPTISAGAEYTQFLQKMINTGNADDLKFNGIVRKLNKQYRISAITTIEGINFDEDASNSGFYHIPPDPNGAAGPNHLVSVVNTSIEWFSKAGVQQNSQSLASFFSSLMPLTGTFDPKVIYDQYNNRFIVVSLEQESASLTSRILVAVSQTSDPNGGWYFHLINSAIFVDGANSWADYPGLAVGSNAIYITANMFAFAGNGYTGGRLWIIAKSPFYSGEVASVTIHDHITESGGLGSTYQPTHMFGNPPTGVGTFLILYSGLSGSGNEAVHIITVSNPLTSPSFNGQTVSLGNVDNTNPNTFTNAPQLGTTTSIATNDRRSLNAVWRNNSLWSVFCVVPPSGVDAGQVTAHWVKINTTTLGTLSLSDQGNIGGESIATVCYTFFPSIVVNSSNDACIGFSASASSIYPGCYYTGRLSSDPSGFTTTPDSVRRGRDYYIRTFGSGSNRWGDYSGSSVDPSDDQTFYIFNEYALTRGNIFGGEDGRWGTAFGVVPVSALPVELSSFTAKVLKGGGVKLDWRTETEVNNFGFEIFSSAQNDSSWIKLGFVEGHGNTNSPKDYTFADHSANYGSFAYRLKQIDNDGQFNYSNIVEINAGEIPNGFVLEQNFPNPFNPSTKIKFALAESEHAELIVFDMLGNEIIQLFNETAESNKIYEVQFDASGLTSGIYFYRFSSGGKMEIRKMLFIK